MAEQSQTRYGSMDRAFYDARIPYSLSHYSLPPNLHEYGHSSRVINNQDEVLPAPAFSRAPDGELSQSYSIQTIASLRPEYAYPDRFYAGERSGGKMSNIRRFFCLFVTFDLLFTSLMWLICIMLRGENIMDAFNQQIYHYNIHSSLFDIVMAAVCRFVALLLFYALLYINHWIIISLTTSATCAFLIGKVFIYNWQGSSQQVFEVLLILISFVISWAEAWFLDFRVIPQEQYASQFLIGPQTQSERAPLLQNFIQNIPTAPTESIGNFYSPLNSPEPSVRDMDMCSSMAPALAITRLSQEESDAFKIEASDIKINAWELLHDPGWKEEKVNDVGDTVYVLQDKKSKIYKIIAKMDAPPRYILEDLFYKVDGVPKWNPTVLQSYKLTTIDEYTDITYQVSANAGGGIISSRDFVTLRHWTIHEGYYLIATKGVVHPDVDKQENYVRGTNGLGCLAMVRNLDNHNETIFHFVLNTDIKGWIPSYVLEPAFITTLFDYVKYLRFHLQKMKEDDFKKEKKLLYLKNEALKAMRLSEDELT